MAGTSAVALLEEFGITATLFVVTSCVNTKRLRWMHALNAVAELRGTDRLLRETDRVFGRRKLDLGISSHSLSVSTKAWPMELKDEIVAEIFQGADMPPMVDYLDEYRPYADWDELKELARRGHRIGLHTRTHPFCSQISTDAIEIEIIAPSRELRARLGVNKLAFAYPFGDRLPNPEIEQRTCERAELSCMLGICGLSRWGTRRWQLDRVDAERGVAVELFSRPMLRAARERFPMASNRRRGGTNIA